MAYYGISSNLAIYMTTKLHQGTVKSSNNVTNWVGTIFRTPILGAYVADAHLGRYLTFVISSAICFLGMLVLTLSVSIPGMKPPECSTASAEDCEKASVLQLAVFFGALCILAIGMGVRHSNTIAYPEKFFESAQAIAAHIHLRWPDLSRERIQRQQARIARVDWESRLPCVLGPPPFKGKLQLLSKKSTTVGPQGPSNSGGDGTSEGGGTSREGASKEGASREGAPTVVDEGVGAEFSASGPKKKKKSKKTKGRATDEVPPEESASLAATSDGSKAKKKDGKKRSRGGAASSVYIDEGLAEGREGALVGAAPDGRPKKRTKRSVEAEPRPSTSGTNAADATLVDVVGEDSGAPENLLEERGKISLREAGSGDEPERSTPDSSAKKSSRSDEGSLAKRRRIEFLDRVEFSYDETTPLILNPLRCAELTRQIRGGTKEMPQLEDLYFKNEYIDAASSRARFVTRIQSPTLRSSLRVLKRSRRTFIFVGRISVERGYSAGKLGSLGLIGSRGFLVFSVPGKLQLLSKKSTTGGPQGPSNSGGDGTSEGDGTSREGASKEGASREGAPIVVVEGVGAEISASGPKKKKKSKKTKGRATDEVPPEESASLAATSDGSKAKNKDEKKRSRGGAASSVDIDEGLAEGREGALVGAAPDGRPKKRSKRSVEAEPHPSTSGTNAADATLVDVVGEDSGAPENLLEERGKISLREAGSGDEPERSTPDSSAKKSSRSDEGSLAKRRRIEFPDRVEFSYDETTPLILNPLRCAELTRQIRGGTKEMPQLEDLYFKNEYIDAASSRARFVTRIQSPTLRSSLRVLKRSQRTVIFVGRISVESGYGASKLGSLGSRLPCVLGPRKSRLPLFTRKQQRLLDKGREMDGVADLSALLKGKLQLLSKKSTTVGLQGPSNSGGDGTSEGGGTSREGASKEGASIEGTPTVVDEGVGAEISASGPKKKKKSKKTKGGATDEVPPEESASLAATSDGSKAKKKDGKKRSRDGAASSVDRDEGLAEGREGALVGAAPDGRPKKRTKRSVKAEPRPSTSGTNAADATLVDVVGEDSGAPENLLEERGKISSREAGSGDEPERSAPDSSARKSSRSDEGSLAKRRRIEFPDRVEFSYDETTPIILNPLRCAELTRQIRGGTKEMPHLEDLYFKNEYIDAASSRARSEGSMNFLVEKYDSALKQTMIQLGSSEKLAQARLKAIERFEELEGKLKSASAAKKELARENTLRLPNTIAYPEKFFESAQAIAAHSHLRWPDLSREWIRRQQARIARVDWESRLPCVLGPRKSRLPLFTRKQQRLLDKARKKDGVSDLSAMLKGKLQLLSKKSTTVGPQGPSNSGGDDASEGGGTSREGASKEGASREGASTVVDEGVGEISASGPKKKKKGKKTKGGATDEVPPEESASLAATSDSSKAKKKDRKKRSRGGAASSSDKDEGLAEGREGALVRAAPDGRPKKRTKRSVEAEPRPSTSGTNAADAILVNVVGEDSGAPENLLEERRKISSREAGSGDEPERSAPDSSTRKSSRSDEGSLAKIRRIGFPDRVKFSYDETTPLILNPLRCAELTRQIRGGTKEMPQLEDFYFKNEYIDAASSRARSDESMNFLVEK
ncbi:hypothetical protein F2Q70_00017923 [Brassica cretica]|uniref:Uncharacterized protein n=1 Tax=Brassica cretica TaxID=69181 RepID=A0A8S9I0Z9_BRACR|nr:hypothetical protein F2Q70_00017923 [Brassica cretica]